MRAAILALHAALGFVILLLLFIMLHRSWHTFNCCFSNLIVMFLFYAACFSSADPHPHLCTSARTASSSAEFRSSTSCFTSPRVVQFLLTTLQVGSICKFLGGFSVRITELIPCRLVLCSIAASSSCLPQHLFCLRTLCVQIVCLVHM